MIIILCGLPGVGKTTLARQIAPLIDADIISTDKIRKVLFKNPTYSKQERSIVWKTMILIAKQLNKRGVSCILDATFNREESRKEARRIIGKKDFFIIQCSCPENVILDRLSKRKGGDSDAGIAVYKKMKRIFEPVLMPHIDICTDLSAKNNAQIILEQINHALKK